MCFNKTHCTSSKLIIEKLYIYTRVKPALRADKKINEKYNHSLDFDEILINYL